MSLVASKKSRITVDECELKKISFSSFGELIGYNKMV